MQVRIAVLSSFTSSTGGMSVAVNPTQSGLDRLIRNL
jgi:hypothetical protein